MSDMIIDWSSAKSQLVYFKAKELRLRREICSKLFGGSKAKQQKKFEHAGFVIKANNTTTMKVDKGALASMILSEDDLKYVDFVPTIQWRDLPDDSPLWGVITETPTTPTLTILETKE